MRGIVLISLLMMLIHTTSVGETTNNLVSQDFTTGWSGTNVDTTHGSDTIAGVDGEYVVSDDISLSTDVELNKPTINNGFTITGSSEIWFWNSYSQSVTQTITTTDDNDNVITQNRVIQGIQNGYQTYSDQLIISSNTQSDYEINLRYDFSVPGTTGHYGADLKNPSLTVEYTFKEELDSTIENEIVQLFEDFKPEEDIKFEEETFKFEEPMMDEPEMEMEMVEFFNEPKINEEPKEEFTDSFTMVEMTEEKKEEEPAMEMMTQLFTEEKEDKEELDNSATEGIIEVVQEESKEEEKNEQPEEIQEEESNSETTQTANASEKSNTKQKSVQSKETKQFSHSDILDKIDEKIKDVGKNLELKNLVTIKAMSDTDILLSAYNVPFYKPKDIYLDQLDISDGREIYNNVTLNRYVANDPIAIRANKINELEIERQQLLIQLEVLKNEL